MNTVLAEILKKNKQKFYILLMNYEVIVADIYDFKKRTVNEISLLNFALNLIRQRESNSK
jgi:hypothetical protein